MKSSYYSHSHLYQNTSNVRLILYIMCGQEVVGGLLASETTSPQGVIKPEETWGDKGRYPLINSENRGDVVYGWSLSDYPKSSF